MTSRAVRSAPCAARSNSPAGVSQCADRNCDYNGKTFAVRSNAVGVAGKIAQCVGVRLPNTVRQVDVVKEVAGPSL